MADFFISQCSGNTFFLILIFFYFSAKSWQTFRSFFLVLFTFWEHQNFRRPSGRGRTFSIIQFSRLRTTKKSPFPPPSFDSPTFLEVARWSLKKWCLGDHIQESNRLKTHSDGSITFITWCLIKTWVILINLYNLLITKGIFQRKWRIPQPSLEVRKFP